MIAKRINILVQNGHRHLHGGPWTEEVIATPRGYKSCRRSDITTRAPDGTLYRENVGLTRVSGQPVPREVKALDDLEDVLGTRPHFTSYDIRRR